MKVTTTATDSLTLELVKAHCNQEESFDDALFNQYIAASLEAVENSTHNHYLQRTWEGTIYESEINLDLSLSLSLPVNPRSLKLTFATEPDYEFEPFEWYYCSGKVKVTLQNVDLLESIATIEATTGEDPISAQANQARLMIIGSWYASRETDVLGLSVADLPSGAMKFLLPQMQGVAI